MRRRGLLPTLLLTFIAAAGGWVWLGLPFAAGWLLAVLAGMAINRGVFEWMARRPNPGRRLEWTLSAITFVYTAIYCVMPFGLAAISDYPTALLAGAAMIGAITLSSTSEFVISRRIGLGSQSALLIASIVICVSRANSEPWPNVLFGAIAILGFFACILQFAMHRVRDDRRFLEAVAEAQGANAAKSLFLATMSHEIRTPLNGVLGMVQAMDAGELDPTQRERLNIIRGSGQALTEILNDVLDLSKIEAGKLELETIPFDLETALRGAVAPFTVLAAEKGLSFALDLSDAAAGRYQGDPARLRQVLANLLSNAVKFTERGGLTVAVTREDGVLRLAVTDTGPGIPPERIGQLFGKFAQLDASTTRRHGGTGLGLAISRELAQLMGGGIIASSTVGVGSTFTLSLPLDRLGDATPIDARPVAVEAVERTGLRVLAAEDNRVNQIVLETLLAQAGIAPVLVPDGEQAVRAWAEGGWDLVLMDVHMPVLDGVSAVREIRAREAAEGRPRTPVIALTANAMTHQVAELLAAGMDFHVAKPIDAGQLFTAMEAALEQAETAAAARAT